MIVTTMNDIPGYTVDEVYGEVFGLTVRSRNLGSQFGSGLKSIVGGELKGQTKALIASRQQVVERMFEEAEAKGANAVIAMRFDASEIGNGWAEICAYGTAVKVREVLTRSALAKNRTAFVGLVAVRETTRRFGCHEAVARASFATLPRFWRS